MKDVEIPTEFTIDCLTNECGNNEQPIVSNNNYVDKVLEDIKQLDFPIALMPTGTAALEVLRLCKKNKIDVDYLVDNNVKGSLIDNKVYSLNDIPSNTSVVIAVSNKSIQNEIIAQLNKNQFQYYPINFDCFFSEIPTVYDFYGSVCLKDVKAEFEKYSKVFSLFSDDASKLVFKNILNYRLSNHPKYLKKILSNGKQYFEPQLYNVSRHDHFVDCGASTGDTIKNLMKVTAGEIQAYYAFEPSDDVFPYLEITALSFKNIVLYKKGVYSKDQRLSFDNNQQIGEQKISESGDSNIDVVCLDNALENKKVTFIKMDIEGAEIDALLGAKNIIQEQQPVLAISVYHKFDDLWEIPLLIKSFETNYKYYLRHYTLNSSETVLYGVPQINQIKSLKS